MTARARATSPLQITGNIQQRVHGAGGNYANADSCWQLEMRPAAVERAAAGLRSRRGSAGHPAEPSASEAER